MVFSYFLFFFCIYTISVFNVHYVYVLLLLELLLLSIFVILGWCFMTSYGLSGLFFYLLVIVCLGGFSISLLVSLARSTGRDFWCFRFVF